MEGGTEECGEHLLRLKLRKNLKESRLTPTVLVGHDYILNLGLQGYTLG
jgi:hypothetical protein